MMSCREVVEFLMDYATGELDAATRARFDAHIAACPACVKFLASYQEAVRLGKAAYNEPCEEIPVELVRAIMAARDQNA